MRLAFLFPGQGAQSAGYLRRLPEHDCVRDTLREAGEHLGMDVAGLDQEPALQSTVAVQLGLLIAGVAQARALAAEGVRPDAVAGLSVGAFGAAVACGCLGFGDALRLVGLRARSMQQAFAEGYGMLAVSGLRQGVLEGLLERIADEEQQQPSRRAYLANLNSASQFVVAGSDHALARVGDAARAAGARQVERLAVAVPSHCPLLAATSAELAAQLATLELRDPEMPYVANTTARVLRKAGDVARDLAEGVMRPVRWHDTNRLLVELGLRCSVEMPPGQALTRLMHNLSCQVDALASEGSSLRSLVLRVRRACSQGQVDHPP